jgi:hypothetical protein
MKKGPRFTRTRNQTPVYQRDSRPDVTKPMATNAPAMAMKIAASVGALAEKNSAITAKMTHMIAIPA